MANPLFPNVNGSDSSFLPQPRPKDPAELWPVPIQPLPGSIQFNVIEGIQTLPDGKTRQVKFIRTAIYNSGGVAFVHHSPDDLVTVLQQALHIARAAKAGLDLPPTSGTGGL